MKLERRSKARESLKSNGNRTRESGESSQLQVLCDQESKELRTTISRLQKLLQLERQEHDANEKKTLQLLTDVKTKWQDREEARVLKVQKEKEDAEKMSEEWKTKASKLEEQLLAEKKELEKVLDVKGCLKAKLKECKGKLESTIVKYESEVKRCKEIELGTTAVHEDSEAENKRLKMNLDNADNKLLAMQKSMDVIRGELEVEKAATKKVKEQAKDSKEQLEEEIKKLRSKNKKLEEENTRVREDLDSLEKENDASKSKMKLKEAKLNDLEGILQNLENKIKPGQGNENSNKPACICETLKSDMGLQKVELRLMEKKNKDLEGRVKFLREVMIKEERDAKDKLADELKVTKEKLAEIEGKADQIEEANKFNEVMKEKLRLMESNLEELRSVRDQSQEYKTQLDFALKKLERAKDTAEDASRTKVNYETMKHTCLELQDQVTEYETLVSKLEKAAVLNKESQEKMTKEIDTLSETVSKLRVEKNEIKSSLIYAETQLKEVKAKHEDVEMLYKREEETWNTR